MRSPIYAMLKCADLSAIVGVPAGSSIFMKLWSNAGGSLLNTIGLNIQDGRHRKRGKASTSDILWLQSNHSINYVICCMFPEGKMDSNLVEIKFSRTFKNTASSQ